MHYLKEIERIHVVHLSKTQVYLEILGELPRALETKVKIDYKLPYVIRQLSEVNHPILRGSFESLIVRK
ncbi:hypothetical protein CR513_39134, partial [Mucuna pruriens]